MNSISGFHFDTTNSIACDVDKKLLDEALELCARYEALLSRFVEGSDVWRVNHAQGKPVEVSTETMTILNCAEELRVASGGAFNIAIGAASSLWRITKSENKGAGPMPPSEPVLNKAAAKLRETHIKLEGNKVSVTAETTLDLGGIAKGYISDRVADFLREAGATGGLLNFGGNVVTIGRRSDGSPWRVGLQTPGVEREQSIFAFVTSSDGAVVTSGVYERAFVFEGRLYHHVLDPRDCRPARSGLLSATVTAAEAMLADGLATALLIMGPTDGLPLVERFGAQAVSLDGQGELSYTSGLPITILDAPTTPQVAVPTIATEG
jgi:thiamine biosynthesis lipoprotein